MLNTWRVRNFKSLAGDVALPLGRVTALCGANSSGKSSVIHSILMMKQSVNSDQIGRQIALNGHWVKLGTFKDVLTYNAKDASLRIEYEFATENYETRTSSIEHSRTAASSFGPGVRSIVSHSRLA